MQVGALGDQDILTDAGFGFDHRIPVQGRVGGNRNGRSDVDHIKNALESTFAVFQKIHDEALRRSTGNKFDVTTQFVEGMAIEKIEFVGGTYPHGSRADIKVTDLAGLDV